MKRIDIMRRAGRNLRQAKGRTFLTSLAIAVGAFTVTASLAAGEGARQYADKIIKSNVDPQSVYVTKDSMRDMADSGKVPAAKIGPTAGYRWVFTDEALEEYLREEVARQTRDRRSINQPSATRPSVIGAGRIARKPPELRKP